MSEVQSDNTKPESSMVSPTELSKARLSKTNKAAQAASSKARVSKTNKAAQAASSKARVSKTNKAAQATHLSDELKPEVRFRKAKKISKLIKRI